jgi:diguanylate cyclase (GGDEF)-like protein
MSDSTDLPFTTLAQSLFSPEEMRELVRSEIGRARRYGFPLTLFLIGVDRLDALHDLYGVASKSQILTAVLSFLRKQVRSSDLIASVEGDRLFLLSPYADRAGGKLLAQRMLAGARQLRFASDDRDLQVTLSIGMAFTGSPDPARAGDLFRAADDAQRLAHRNGGDRVLEIDLLEVAPEPVRPTTGDAPQADVPSLANPLGGLTPEEVVTVVRDALEQLGLDPSRLADAGEASATDAGGQAEVQDRRISKLAAAVENLQAQLSALSRGAVAPDEGRASLGKVFGALGTDGDDEKRKELMGALFRANLQLQRRREEGEPNH